ncbi:MAG: SDR family NAD(P)-dependent oxidoreductase [Chlorobi bacterium CHB2]|nr:SDR family NAD(P)-dependent oxidoreductase [Chlorobi bacterium CHB2]
MKPLTNSIAVVAGATRGAGRGIARMLGEAGATVYCTGRSTRQKIVQPRTADTSPFSLDHRSETIEETAEMVTELGGIGIPVQTDHTDEQQVERLFQRVRAEQGKLDILINDVWGGDALIETGKPFWELNMEKGLTVLQRGIHSHIITSRHGAPLMVEAQSGLIVEITDAMNFSYMMPWGNLFYDLVKSSVIRLAFTMAQELRPHGVAAVAVTPGFLRSEAMLEHFGVTEQNWEEGAAVDPHFIMSETPNYVGRGIAALAADPNILSKTGQVFSSWSLAREYGFADVDGRTPDFGRYFATSQNPDLAAMRETMVLRHNEFTTAFRGMEW